MSNPFEKAKGAVREMKAAIYPTVKETFEKYGYVVKDYQVNKQLFEKGQDSKGSIIRPAYSPLTVSIKRKKRQPHDRVTLKDSGRLHESIRIIPKGDEVEIVTSVPYAKYLFKKYGDDILGIQEELLREFLEIYILPNLKKAFNDKLAES
jgi:hypothetical protein